MTVEPTLAERLKRELSQLEVLAEEPLAQHTSFRIGGPAEAFARPKTEEELGELLRLSRKWDLKPLILGAGTNVLAPDEGLRGLVICTRDCLNALVQTGPETLTAQSGVTLARTAILAKDLGLTGMEFAHGIPGTVGGGIFMNAGAYGGELKQILTETRIMELDGTIRTVAGEDQDLSYRHSAFMDHPCVILGGTFRLSAGDPAAIKEKMQELAARRRASQPLELPSAGSTFKRPEGYFAGTLIQEAGLKGFRIGGAAVSEKHAGFVVNLGGATAKDVLAVIEAVQQRVYENAGVRLTPEVRIL